MDPEGRVIPIHDPGDPRIDAFRDVKDRDLAGRQGAFIAESEKVIRRLIGESPFRTMALLLNPQRAAAMADVIQRCDPATCVYVAEQPIFDAIAGFHIHRGALALGERPVTPSPDAFLQGMAPDATVLVLEDLVNHDNVGGIFRCAAAFGAGGIILTDRCADPLYRKATRVSIGATLTIPYTRAAHGSDAIAALRAHGFTTLALTPSPDAVEINQCIPVPQSRRTALLLGGEGPGLDARTQRDADHRVRLGRMAQADSLNVVVAAGIALYSIHRREGDAA